MTLMSQRKRNASGANLPGWEITVGRRTVCLMTPWCSVLVIRWGVAVYWAANKVRREGEPLFLRSLWADEDGLDWA
jgi:hypothetical protein